LKPNCGCFLCGETEEVGRGEYRSRHVAEPNQLVAGEQPSRPRFFESRPLRSGGGNSDGGGEALRALRNWIEQSYKQVKNALGWAHYQVRKNISIRRHWQMVCCAFTFCWWEGSDLLGAETLPGVTLQAKEPDPASETRTAEGEKRSDPRSKPPELSWPLALRRVRAWLEPYVMLMRYSGGRSGICPRQRG
jgi:hypothetical protein